MYNLFNRCFYIVLAVLSVSAGMVNAYESEDGSLTAHGFLENATYTRFHGVGISKSRTTGQVEVSKRFGRVGIFRDFTFNGTFRGTFDAVYEINDGEFGDNAGGPLTFESTAIAAGVGTTPWGASPITTGVLGFGFDTTTNPNTGLVHLGGALHNPFNGGVGLAVPVRPCDEDSRGCIDGYLDYDKQELAAPEFNDRADFIREAYFSGTIPLSNGNELDISFGRQQVVWGRTDLFRVLDVINPVDFSRNNIYDELEDIRIPMGILTAEHRWGATDVFDDINIQLLWKWEQFRPNNLGQGGTPNSILDAGSLFRGLNNCWDNGCTVSNFAGGVLATDFPKHTIGIRRANMPDWDIEETDVGLRLEGVYKSVGFSINALYYTSQLPSLRGRQFAANNPFTPGEDLALRDYLIAFDIDFPRIFLLGGSTDFYVDKIKTAVRTEFAFTSGEEFANTTRRELYSENDVIRWVVGLDRPTFIPFLNERRAYLISAQIFGQHILDHDLEQGLLGKVGIPDWENNIITTLLIKGFYKNDQLSPQVIMAYDVRAQAAAIAPSVDWLISDSWRLQFGANFKVGTGARPFDDNRTANVFPPFTGAGPIAGSVGLGGFEPLGRFRSGPLGMAQNEDELQVTLRYRF